MSEITKLYENAEVEREFAYFECHRGRSSICCPIEEYEKDDGCMGCINSSAMKEVYEYPPFTAEKQLKLIKWIAEKKEECRITYDKEYEWCTQTDWQSSFCYDNFSASLANLINTIWKDLTSEEKQQVKGILE